MRGSFEKLLILIFAFPRFLILCFIVINLMGYEINKEYFSYSKESCIANINKYEMERELYSKRWSELLDKNNWFEEFVPDYSYCRSTYESYTDQCDTGTWEINEGSVTLSSSKCEEDTKCGIGAYIQAKQGENSNYLVSKEKDQFYWNFVNNKCPEQHLLK